MKFLVSVLLCFGCLSVLGQDGNSKPVYDVEPVFFGGSFGVAKKGGYGVVDTNHQVVIDFKYAYLKPKWARAGGAVLYTTTRDGHSPDNALLLVSPEKNTHRVEVFSDNLQMGNFQLLTKDNVHFAVFDMYGKQVTPFNLSLPFMSANAYYRFLVKRNDSTLVMQEMNDAVRFLPDVDTLSICDWPKPHPPLLSLSNGRLVLQTAKGKIIDNGYDRIEPQTDSKAGRIVNYLVQKNGKLGLLDDRGKPITPIEYDEIESLYRTGATFKPDDRMVFWQGCDADEQINFFLHADLDARFVKRHKLLWKVCKGGKCGLIDHKGTTILPMEYDPFMGLEYSRSHTRERYLLAGKNRRSGLFDLTTLSFGIPPEYDYIDKKPNYYTAFEGHKACFFDNDLELVDSVTFIAWDKYSIDKPYQTGEFFYYTKQAETNGVELFRFDPKRKVREKVLDESLDSIYNPEGNLLFFSKNGLWGVFNASCHKLISNPVYDEILYANGFVVCARKGPYYGFFSCLGESLSDFTITDRDKVLIKTDPTKGLDEQPNYASGFTVNGQLIILGKPIKVDWLKARCF